VTLDELNSLPHDAAARSLHACGGSRRWVDALLAQRPFASLDELLNASDAAWRGTRPNDWHEAFAGHPRIGERATAQTDDRTADDRRPNWSAAEQSAVDAADAATRSALADGNREYEARFGHIFLVCASGKSAAELLELLRTRLRNAPDEELAVAGDELRKIARARLEKLLAPKEGVRR
jgi:2-oxo-4-hydroxy-4-carboxy-5-ureidoimidazoline decarboxylase